MSHSRPGRDVSSQENGFDEPTARETTTDLSPENTPIQGTDHTVDASNLGIAHQPLSQAYDPIPARSAPSLFRQTGLTLRPRSVNSSHRSTAISSQPLDTESGPTSRSSSVPPQATVPPGLLAQQRSSSQAQPSIAAETTAIPQSEDGSQHHANRPRSVTPSRTIPPSQLARQSRQPMQASNLLPPRTQATPDTLPHYDFPGKQKIPSLHVVPMTALSRLCEQSGLTTVPHQQDNPQNRPLHPILDKEEPLLDRQHPSQAVGPPSNHDGESQGRLRSAVDDLAPVSEAPAVQDQCPELLEDSSARSEEPQRIGSRPSSYSAPSQEPTVLEHGQRWAIQETTHLHDQQPAPPTIQATTSRRDHALTTLLLTSHVSYLCLVLAIICASGGILIFVLFFTRNSIISIADFTGSFLSPFASIPSSLLSIGHTMSAATFLYLKGDSTTQEQARIPSLMPPLVLIPEIEPLVAGMSVGDQSLHALSRIQNNERHRPKLPLHAVKALNERNAELEKHLATCVGDGRQRVHRLMQDIVESPTRSLLPNPDLSASEVRKIRSWFGTSPRDQLKRRAQYLLDAFKAATDAQNTNLKHIGNLAKDLHKLVRDPTCTIASNLSGDRKKMLLKPQMHLPVKSEATGERHMANHAITTLSQTADIVDTLCQSIRLASMELTAQINLVKKELGYLQEGERTLRGELSALRAEGWVPKEGVVERTERILAQWAESWYEITIEYYPQREK